MKHTPYAFLDRPTKISRPSSKSPLCAHLKNPTGKTREHIRLRDSKSKENERKPVRVSKVLQAVVGNVYTLLEQNKNHNDVQAEKGKASSKTPCANYARIKPTNTRTGNRAVSALKPTKLSNNKNVVNRTNNEERYERTHMRYNSGDVSKLVKGNPVEHPKEINSNAGKVVPVNKLIGALKGLVSSKNHVQEPICIPQSTKGNSKPILKEEPVQAQTMMKTAYQAYLAKAIKEANAEISKKPQKTNVTCPETKEKREEETCISGKFADSLEYLVVGRQIGQGAYASVRVAFDKALGCKVALKIYDKSKLVEPQRQKSVQREIKIMEKLNHPHIVKLYAAFDTRRHVVLQMENVKGTSLHGFLKSKDRRRLDEVEAKKVFRQVVNGIEYCHSRSIAHRDIKLENLLLDENQNVKIIDFGFSTCMPNNKKIRIFCGTPSYMSPEIVTRKEYAGPPADIWALGVLLYAILCGTFPFKGSSDKDLYRRITRGQFTLPDHLSSASKSLIVKILNVDADKRPTAHEIANDPWLQMFTDPPKQLSSRPVQSPTNIKSKPINVEAHEAYHGGLSEKVREKKRTAILLEADHKKPAAVKKISNNIAPGSTINNNFNIINNITHINCPPVPKSENENDSLAAKSNASSVFSKQDPSARAENSEGGSVDYDLITSIVRLGYSIEEVQKQLQNENSHVRALYERLARQKKKLNLGVCPQFVPSMMSYEKLKTPKGESRVQALNGTTSFIFGGKPSTAVTPTTNSSSRGLFRPLYR